ncbi:MAG TPA: rRNA adenine N-6-methyltransferase family protein [Herpetosiphonaceae bacterium]
MALKKEPSWLDRALVFGRNFFKHPQMLGSAIPSSRFLINRLLRRVDWSIADVIVEYGPGVGVFTTEILRRMRPEATLIVFETNGEFVEFLRRTIDDARLHVIHGSAAEIGTVLGQLGLTHADYIISGIPYSTMPAEIRSAILDSSYEALSRRGAFLVYQFSNAAKPYLQQVFKSVELDFEPLNILPARLFYCRG